MRLIAELAIDKGAASNVVAAAEMPSWKIRKPLTSSLRHAPARGVNVTAATLVPFEGLAFDGVIDPDSMPRDPDHPSGFPPNMRTANKFAPSVAGGRMIADAPELKLLRYREDGADILLPCPAGIPSSRSSGPRLASYLRHRSIEVRNRGCRTCTALAVFTGRLVR